MSALSKPQRKILCCKKIKKTKNEYMKRLNLLAVMATLLFSCVCIINTSCSKYEELEEVYNQKPPQDPDNGDEGEDEDDNDNNQDGDWGTIIEKTYGYLGEDQWPSTIKLQKSDGSEVLFSVNLPFTLTEWTDEYLVEKDETPSEFVEVCQPDTACTAWSKDEEGNYLRKVTRTQVIKFTKFTRTIVSESWEAYRYINGKEEYFKTGNTTLSFNPYSGHSQELTEVTKDGIKYLREANLVDATIKFHTESYKLSAYTYIDRESGEDGGEDDDNGDDNGGNNDGDEPETMPDAMLNVAKIVKISDLTSSPKYNLAGTGIEHWHTVALVEDEEKFYIYVDGSFVKEWNKSEFRSGNYNSAMLDNGVWIPALLKLDNNGGWNYTSEPVNGSPKYRTMSKELALFSNIKNFTKNGTAETSPFVKTTTDTKTYGDKNYISVYGFKVDGSIYTAFTVAEK